jgi:tetratricopeptide (TPR) repeat protein
MIFRSRRSRGRALVVTLIVVAASGGAGCGTSKNTSSPPTTAKAASNAAAAQALLEEGISQAQSKMFDQAATTFKNVLLLSPKNVYALYNLGVIDQSEKNAAGALSYYDQALRADGSYTPAMYNKAIILEATNLDAALALYKQIVLINPKASTAYLRMAFVYAKQGQALKATEARTKAVALDASLSKYPLPAKCSQPNC